MSHISIEDLKPKFQEQPMRYNNWYFVVQFTHQGRECIAKFALIEGTLLGQGNQIFFSNDAPVLVDGSDTKILRKGKQDIGLFDNDSPIEFQIDQEQVVVNVGDLTAICTPEKRRLVSKNASVSADLVFTPRALPFYWGNQQGGLCAVTESTRVSGVETLSDVKGAMTVNGEKIEVEGRGLFERVWFQQLGFFEIRVMNWIFANFDQLYVYLCHCESDDSKGGPFHFETGDVYLMLEGEMLVANRFEFEPQSWVFAEEFRRFIPLEQTVKVKTDKGNLTMNLKLANYIQLIQNMRLETMTMKNIPGWAVLFYDAPIAIEGEFTYKDGKKVKLTNGRGVNELIRLSPM